MQVQAAKRKAIVREIRELREKLERWRKMPMTNAVRNVGILAIRERLQQVSQPLVKAERS